jgi:hypothetical protein
MFECAEARMNRREVVARLAADIAARLRCCDPPSEALRSVAVSRQSQFAETIFAEFDDGFVEQAEFDDGFRDEGEAGGGHDH